MYTVEELTQDKELMEALSRADTPEAVMNAFKTKGFDLSLEEAAQVLDLAENNDELSEDDLSAVSGGFGSVFVGICVLAIVVGFARGIRCKK